MTLQLWTWICHGPQDLILKNNFKNHIQERFIKCVLHSITFRIIRYNYLLVSVTPQSRDSKKGRQQISLHIINRGLSYQGRLLLHVGALPNKIHPP